MSDILRLARTVRLLRPAQVAHRVRLRAQRSVLHRVPLEGMVRRSVGDAPGWPTAFEPLDLATAPAAPDAESNARHEFRFLHETRALGTPPDWRPAGASQLWRYHLHYWDWAWALLRHDDRDWATTELGKLWRSWRAGTRFGRWDEWSPYVAATRTWVLAAMVSRAPAAERDELAEDLALHVRFLRWNLERDVGGNHLVRDLKGVLGGAAAVGSMRTVARATRLLERECERQVLADGGHDERSPAYHAQVLGDLDDVSRLLDATGAPSAVLDDTVHRMRRWLATMTLPDGAPAPFNDTFAVPPARMAQLLAGLGAPADSMTVLDFSGFVVARCGRLHVVIDVGLPCPPTLPAHAHADCLSFVASVDGARVLSDAGSSTYVASTTRQAERGTRGHSTVQVDEVDQTEVYGAFRAGRRAHPTVEVAAVDGEVVRVVASHDGYRHLPGSPVHRRSFAISDDVIEVVDEVHGGGMHRLTSRLHAAPGIDVTPERIGPFVVEAEDATWVVAEDTTSVDLGDVAPSSTLVRTEHVTLPVRWSTVLRLRQPEAGASVPSLG